MKQNLGIFIGLTLAIAFSVFAFTEPALAPPGGNVAAPINVSGTAQTKAGKLNIGGGLSYWITKVGDSFALQNNAGDTKLIVGQDGNVGIGTANPGAKLSFGNSIADNKIYLYDGQGAETNIKYGFGIRSAQLLVYTGPNDTDVISFGKMNGTTYTEGARLDSNTSWGTGLSLNAGGVSGGRNWLIASTGGDAGQGQGKLIFYDNSGAYSAMTIQGAGAGSGRVGIGTTNPTSRLDVVADFDWPTPTIVARGNIAHPNIQIKSDQPGSRDWRIISCGASGCGPAGALRFFDNSGGGDRMVIMPDGNVGIGTTQPGFKLTVAGKIYSSVGVDGESLCIKGDCKTAWSQVGGSGGFGGMYTMLSVNGGAPFCSISNPKTGGCSCPAGNNSTFIHRSYGPCSEWTCSGGTRYIWDLYMCWQ